MLDILFKRKVETPTKPKLTPDQIHRLNYETIVNSLPGIIKEINKALLPFNHTLSIESKYRWDITLTDNRSGERTELVTFLPHKERENEMWTIYESSLRDYYAPNKHLPQLFTFKNEEVTRIISELVHFHLYHKGLCHAEFPKIVASYSKQPQ